MVTGAGGYIGTQLVRDLVKAGHEVTAVDRFFFGKEPLSEFIGNNIAIGEKGNLLSTGQKQRLALARALYFKKENLILIVKDKYMC